MMKATDGIAMKKEICVGNTVFTMILVEGGCFRMGDENGRDMEALTTAGYEVMS